MNFHIKSIKFPLTFYFIKNQSIPLICSFVILSLFVFGGNLNIGNFFIESRTEKSHFIINSAFYYNVSKLYNNNSMVVIFNGERKLKESQISLKCHSQNKTDELQSEAQIRIGFDIEMECLWEIFILNCTTVLNPDSFGFSMKDTIEIVNVEFELPEQQKYPVIMCYPPMVYESRWQQIIFATEIYHYFGTDLQIQYINSAMKEIIDILEKYERKGWVKIKYFPFYDFKATTISSLGVHPMLEVHSRNQPVAYTDCLMKYRESSDFVIIADVDDILVPKSGSYFKEFSAWNKLYPNAAAFMYDRRFAKIEVSKEIQDFSIYNSVKSLLLLNDTVIGKSVYQTKNAETAWIHFPGLHNKTTVEIWHEKMLHIQITAVESMNILKTFNDSINEKNLRNMQAEFELMFKNFSNFETSNVYADAIFKCYAEHRLCNPKNTKLPSFSNCLNPLQCDKPEIVKNFHCSVARRDFHIHALNNNAIFYVPKSEHYMWTMYRYYFYDKFTTIIVLSSTYYNVSSIYPPNSVVVHFNAHRNTSTSQIWYCISSNSTHQRFVSEIYPNKPFFQPLPCQMQAFASNCTTVENPTYFALASEIPDEESKAISATEIKEVPLLLRNAIHEKLPVVSCVSPLFFNERWQINMLSIEIYAYFGVSRQAYYYMSVLEDGFNLLKEYEKLRMISLQPWIVPDVHLMRKGLEFRNQATAHNDCYLLYREAADFIIVHDPDDLLFIKDMTNFWISFVRLHLDNPFTAGFQFGRFNSFIQISNSLKNTSISKSLESIKIGKSKVFLKSAYSTRSTENVNAHFAAYLKPKFFDTFLPNNSGLFVHIRNISYVEDFLNPSLNTDFEGDYKNITTYIDPKHFAIIEKVLKKRMSKFMAMDELKNLSLVNNYYQLIDDCYERVYYKHENTNGKSLLPKCPTHFHCQFPEIPGLHCIHAKQDFIRRDLKDLIIYAPQKSALNVLSENGCNLD